MSAWIWWSKDLSHVLDPLETEGYQNRPQNAVLRKSDPLTEKLQNSAPKNSCKVRTICTKHNISSSHRRRYLVSKIQNGSQLTGSSNISETTKHQNSNTELGHLTMANSQKVYLGDSNNRKWRPKPKILMSLKLCEVPLKFQRQNLWFIRPCKAGK